MREFRLTLIAITLLGTVASVRAGLTEDIRPLLQDKAFAKSEIGVEILSLGEKPEDAKVLFRHNSDIPLMPASNLKLVTTSAALEKLGPTFKFRTVLVRRPSAAGDDLIIIGDGDPTFGDGEAMKRIGWDITSAYQQWIDLLKKQNVTAIHDVCVDDSIFDQGFYHPDWDPKQYLEGYRPEVAGLNLNLNLLDFYVKATSSGQAVEYSVDPPTHFASIVNQCITGGDKGVWFSRDQDANNLTVHGEIDRSNVDPVSVPVHDPPLYAATVFADMCRAAGIK